jgi:DNA-binding transcriptional LysR family regulator
MELRQLEYFVAVAEEGSFTRAAERVHVAQPGVSAQIRRLERELGAELLDRSGRTVRLTEAGEAVLPYARAALAAVAGARLAVEELTGLLRGRVAVGTVTAHGVDLPGLLAAFHRDHPGVEITLTTATTDRLLDDLRGGRLDAAIVSIGEDAPPGVEIHVVEEQPIVAAVAPGHELADREVVPLAGLRGHALICLPPGTGVRARLDEACAASGFAPRVAFEAADPGTLARLAAHGLGVAVLPRVVAELHADRLRVVRIDPPALRGRLAFAWRASGPVSPAARALIARARATLAYSAV